MLYKLDFVNRKLYKNDIELDTTSLMLGRFEGTEDDKAIVLNEQDDEKVYKLFLDISGNYVKENFSDEYDYFDSHHPVDIITMAKLVLYPVRFIPEVAKDNDMYRKLKLKFSF